MQLTYINMYRRWIGEETFETEESGLTNGTVVGLTAGGIGCFVILLSIIMSFIMIGILTAAHDNPDIHDRIEKFAEENNIDIDWSDFDSLYDEINNCEYPLFYKLSSSSLLSANDLHSNLLYKLKNDETDKVYKVLVCFLLGQYIDKGIK